MPQRAHLLHQWKFSSIRGSLTPHNATAGMVSILGFFFNAFIRLLYFLLSWFMDISSIPGLYLVSESLTRKEDSTSTLWRDPVPKCVGSADQSWSASGRTPASTDREHRETDREGKWKEKKVIAPMPGWDGSKRCPGSPGKGSSAGSCSAPCSWSSFLPWVPSALPAHLQSFPY